MVWGNRLCKSANWEQTRFPWGGCRGWEWVESNFILLGRKEVIFCFESSSILLFRKLRLLTCCRDHCHSCSGVLKALSACPPQLCRGQAASPAVFPGPAYTCCCYSAARLMSPCELGLPHLVPPVGPLWALCTSSFLRTISADFVISIQVPVALYPLVGICDAVVPRSGEGNQSLLTPCGQRRKALRPRVSLVGGFPPNPAGFRDHFSVSHPNQCLSSMGACSGVLSYMGERDSWSA